MVLLCTSKLEGIQKLRTTSIHKVVQPSLSNSKDVGGKKVDFDEVRPTRTHPLCFVGGYRDPEESYNT